MMQALRPVPALTSAPRHNSLHSSAATTVFFRRNCAALKATANEKDTIKKTVSALDALLGIEEETKPAIRKDATASSAAVVSSELDTSSTSTSSTSRPASKQEQEFEDQFQKIIERARQLGDAQQSNQPGALESQQQQLRKEFETLLQTMSKDQGVLGKDDIKRLKEAAFSPTTFWVTDVSQLVERDRLGVVVRGNLRDDRSKVFQIVQAKVAELFDSKFEVLLVEDADASGEEPTPQQLARGPKVAFQIVPVAQTQPPQAGAGRQAIAVILFALSVASSLNVALVANIAKLPKETLAYFANPDNFSGAAGAGVEALPPGLESWDPTSYLLTAVPTFLALLGIAVAHELGHRVAASATGAKLGPTYFVPNLQLGSFGAITPFASLLKDCPQLWSIAAAGPLAGLLASGAIFLYGLSQSTPGELPGELLVPVPSALFQGSLLLGTLTKFLLGGVSLKDSNEVLVSPFVIAGWCGLITNALNLLPVGSLDGGRMVQASFGTRNLSLSTFFSFVGLGLGFLGGNLSLPFGLYVVLCQRTAERYIQDSVTPTGSAQQTATAVAVLTAVLILIPMAPEFAEQLGVGPVNPFL